MDQQVKIPKRILSSLLNSLSAGVVPRMGAPYVAIGRNEEIGAILNELDLIKEGGSSMRFIIGKYGSGKSFLIQLIRSYAAENNFVTADADLSPERKLCGTNGSGLATYRELINNLSCKSSPDGNALPQIIAKWFSELQIKLVEEGFVPDSPAFKKELTKRIYETCRKLEAHIGGFDFASVLSMYYEAYTEDDEQKKSACVRWLRGEYNTKTEARAALAINSVIGDSNWYDYIKLLSAFVQILGYNGLVVCIDECVNLYKISNRISRENNYEKILSMFNDTLSGNAPGLFIIIGGTPQFLEDPRRGLFSYEALRSRLADPGFAPSEYKNIMGPLIRLRRLSDNELFAMILRITSLHSQYYAWEPPVSDTDMQDFLRLCLSRAGADTLITPREIIRDYIFLLNILMQNRDAKFADIMSSNADKLRTAPSCDPDDIFSDIEL